MLPVFNTIIFYLLIRIRTTLRDRCHIHNRKMLLIGILQAGQKCIGSVQRSQYIDTCLNGGTADQETIFHLVAVGRCINHQIDLMLQKQIHQSRCLLIDAVDRNRQYPVLI